MGDDLAARVSALLVALVPDLPEGGRSPGAWYDAHADLSLDLSSLQVVQLVDALEASFDLRLTSDDVQRAHFASARALVARLAARGVAP